jgi:hypothetical protein
MALDTTTTSLRSRRALLAGTVGGLALLAAKALGRPSPIQAGTGAVKLGSVNRSADATVIRNESNSRDVLRVVSTGHDGVALRAHSTGASGTAIHGHGTIGVHASGGRYGVGVEAHSRDGVAIDARSVTGTGLLSLVEGDQPAVWAHSRKGSALRGVTDEEGIALETFGPVQFNGSCGVLTIPAGSRSVTLSYGYRITRDTKVLATLMGNPGGTTTIQRVSKRAGPVGTGSFTIHLTAAAIRDVTVVFFVIS